MKPKQFTMLLLISLFIWAYQSSIIHNKYHHFDEMSECHVCHTSEKLDLGHHHSTPVVVSEQSAVRIREDVEKIVVRPRFDYKDVKPHKKVDILETHSYFVFSSPLGFSATAPPLTYTL